MRGTLWLAMAFAVMLVPEAPAAPTRSSPLAVATDGTVFAVNPDSNTIARLDFSSMTGALTHETPVGTYPRTVAAAGTWVFAVTQGNDEIWRCDQADLGSCQHASLGAGCGPYGVAATSNGTTLVVSCQASGEAVILGTSLSVTARVKLQWPNPRAIAISSDGSKAYVTHYLTEEPGTDGHVSVLDLANKSIAAMYIVGVDDETCETQNSGRGVLNQLASIALVPDNAPPEVAGQIWIGGVQENNVTKGLFKRYPPFKSMVGSDMFPLLPYAPTPASAYNRNIYRPSFHDVARFGIVKLNADGSRVGKIDVDEANIASDIEISADGTVAYVVDQMFHSFHVMPTKRGQGSDVTTLFGGPSAFGPGGADPSQGCIANALTSVTNERPFRVAPQAQLTPIDGYNPTDASLQVITTGVDFDTVAYQETGVSKMRHVTDSVGTAPIGVRLSADGETAYVLNYLSRNVVRVGTHLPVAVGGKPENLRCAGSPAQRCGMNNDCPGGVGFCNHPGGAACTQDIDCGPNGPCILSNDCVPLLLGPAVSTITGKCEGGASDGADCKVDADCTGGTCNGIAGDPLLPELLDGKILFNTAGRDASVPNEIGLGQAAPLFNQPRTFCSNNPAQACIHHGECGDPSQRLCKVSHSLPGEVVSTAHDASYVACNTCHADFGGQDGRTWDFSQFGASLRNTMDLRGRAGFNPGKCSNDPGQECFFDAACGQGNLCKAEPSSIPPNVPQADRDRWFNPMLTIHWNGDRDEVEDFEATIRQLQGSADCDANEQNASCPGGLVQRELYMVNELPRTNSKGDNDVEPDLGAPNRNLPGTAGTNVGIRLTHLADFVYSLTSFVKNPNTTNPESEEGRKIFNDTLTGCADCHNGGPPGSGKQFFTDKAVQQTIAQGGSYDPNKPAGPDVNNPFVRHNVGTMNLFDEANPFDVATDSGIFQNALIPIPGPRGSLGDYITPILNDVWNTAPFLHDGSAHTLLDVVRPCASSLDECEVLGRGRNIDDKHGVTSKLTPKQLNQLVAFQNVLATDTVLGNRLSDLKAGTMTIKAAKVDFGKIKNDVRKPGSFKITATLAGAPISVDPSQGVTLELATPGGGSMTIREWVVPMKGKGKKFTGKLTTDGKVTVKISGGNGGNFKLSLVGKKVDLSALDTGNPDVTVSVEIGQAQFVRNRNLVAKKGVYKLPKKK